MTQRRLLTVKEFAAEYRTDVSTVYRWMKTGAVTVLRVGPRRGVRIVLDDHLVFLSPHTSDQTS